MDFATARRFLIAQTTVPTTGQSTFIDCLRQGQPPVPGQVTSILLALKTLMPTLAQEPTLDRAIAHSFFVLTYESRQLYWQGQNQGIEWPPLLSEDLTRIAETIQSILAAPS